MFNVLLSVCFHMIAWLAIMIIESVLVLHLSRDQALYTYIKNVTTISNTMSNKATAAAVISRLRISNIGELKEI